LANSSPLLPFAPVKFWHATCGKNGMARKMNALKMAREPAAAGNRHQMAPTAALYLAQLRQHVFKVPPRARLQIAVQIEEQSQTPRVVKIIHTDSI
jgi:hypothetical protein